jgi:hypothetical protein
MPSKWDDLKDRHIGETCWIVGNGKSLADVPLAVLCRLPSLGCNRIYKEPRGFTPTYWTGVGPEVFFFWHDEPFEELAGKVKGFFAHDRYVTSRLLQKFPDETILPVRSSPTPIFSLNPAQSIHEGFTVTFANLQIAHWMGFSRALLIGVDHRWIVPEGCDPRRPFVREGPDPNHFCHDYIPEGHAVMYNPDSLVHATNAFTLALEQYRRDGKMEVLNATPGSDLRVFPEAEWQQFA